MVQVAVGKVRATLEVALGEGLIALYRYGGSETPRHPQGRANEGLLAVVADEIDLHQLREAFLPIWDEAGAVPGRTPLIVPRSAFRRHLHFFPLFAEYLARYGELLTGENLCDGESIRADSAEWAGYLAYQTMRASRALVPDLIAPDQVAADRATLYRVARRLTGASLPANMPTALLFGKIQRALHGLAESVPERESAPGTQAVSASAEPPLLAIYSDIDRTVCVLPELSTRILLRIDWDRLQERLQPQHAWIQVTTVAQMRLMLQTEAALELVLGRYEHRWGDDPLANLTVSLRTVWRNAGRLPSRLSIDDVPGAYLRARDAEAIHKVVHDYQNRLLNMRLQHELLHRLHGFDPAAPPEPLPGREQPLSARVDAVLQHLAWWAGYYHEQMQQCDLNEKISAL